MQHRLGEGDHQLLHGDADIGGGDDKLPRLHRVLIPGALARVIVAGIEGGVLAGHHPLGRTKVGKPEATRGVGLLQVGHQLGLGVIADQVDQRMDGVLAIRHPFADGDRVGVAIVDRLALDGAHGAGF